MTDSVAARTGSDGPDAVVRKVLQAIFAGDMSVFEGHPGLVSMRRTFPRIRAGIPDLSAELQQQLVEGDRVASHWLFRGTHLGPLWGIAPTGRSLQFVGVSIARVEGGRIVQYDSAVGWLNVLIQIGVLPVRPTFPPP